MPRIARQKSSSGIYHIMLRGANRQEIFHDEEDCVRFLDTLDRYKKTSEVKVYGWCLMGNHVHLLLQEGNEELAVTMKRLGVSYAWFYNCKYRTTGHLFQDRYRSEKVESDKCLIAVIRYIHQNPVKAGMVKKPETWKWSSCNAYYLGKDYPFLLLDSNMILGIFSEDNKTALQMFKEFNDNDNEDDSENEDKFIDNEAKNRLTDDEAREAINKVITGCKIANIKSLAKQQRDEIVRRIKGIDGLSQRQISRILGISLSVINRA